MSVNGIVAYTQTHITYTRTNVPGHKKDSNNPRTDTLTLTEEAQKFLQTQRELENTSKNKKDPPKDDLQRLIEYMNKTDDEDSSGSFMDIAKCMKIARRIQNGDKVPLKDIKFLAKKEPKLFMMAMTFRRNDNPKPKKYKTALDKNDTRDDDCRTMSETESAGEGMSIEALTEGLGEE